MVRIPKFSPEIMAHFFSFLCSKNVIQIPSVLSKRYSLYHFQSKIDFYYCIGTYFTNENRLDIFWIFFLNQTIVVLLLSWLMGKLKGDKMLHLNKCFLSSSQTRSVTFSDALIRTLSHFFFLLLQCSKIPYYQYLKFPMESLFLS